MQQQEENKSSRKIIHIDMDCFYAAVEIRDNPSLANKPVAVGSPYQKRGVLCTCNYIAREYGVRSAMPNAVAYRHCKDLIILPVDMPKYKQVAQSIHAIFCEFTGLVEPLSLDEAFLDVSNASHLRGSATLIAQAIRQCIWEKEALTASAGVAPNKFLAKIASGWKKPNALFVIKPEDVQDFIFNLPVTALFGVGKVTADKLHQLGLRTCADIQKRSLQELTMLFGKLGKQLYEQSRGIDERPVEPNRARKSLSVEQTFSEDINASEALSYIRTRLYDELLERLHKSAPGIPIKNYYIKIKFNNFQLTTAEMVHQEMLLENFLLLFNKAYSREQKPIRLIGLGVHFNHHNSDNIIQGSLF